MKIIDQTDLLNEKAESAAVPEKTSEFVTSRYEVVNGRAVYKCTCTEEVIAGMRFLVNGNCPIHTISRSFYQQAGERAASSGARLMSDYKKREKK